MGKYVPENHKCYNFLLEVKPEDHLTSYSATILCAQRVIVWKLRMGLHLLYQQCH